MIKKTLIILITFFLILWIQNLDDKRNKRIRKSLYEKYKMPLLVSSIVGLVISLNFNKSIYEQIVNTKSNKVTLSDVDTNLTSPESNIEPIITQPNVQNLKSLSTPPKVQIPEITPPITQQISELPSATNMKSDITDQNVYTDLGNF